MKLIGRAQVFWEELEYMRFIKQESSITDWEDMKVKLQDEYLSPYFRAKYLPQSYYGNSQVQQGNTRYWSSHPIAPCQENKMRIRLVSNPQPTQAPSSMAQALKNLEQAIQNTSTELQRINARLDSVEKSFQTKPNHLENVASTFVQQEELIVEPKQQEKKDSTLLDEEKVPQESEILKGAHEVKFDCDECATSQPSKVLKDTKLAKMDKIDTIVLPPIEEKTSPFDSPIPHIDFVIPNIFSDVVEHHISLFFMLPKAAVYKTGSTCAAFLANVGTKSDATVNFNGNSYHLPAWSVSILPDCKNVVLNTAKINSVTMVPSFIHQSLNGNFDSSEALGSDWSWINEPVGISKDNAFVKLGLLEQINTTADQSDYLWYSLSIDIKGNEPFLEDGSQTVLHVESLGHALHVFINGKFAGSGKGNSDNANVSLEISIALVAGKNTIDLLSLTVGLQNYGAFYDKKGAGITGPVKLKGVKSGTSVDLSSQQWTYQVGLKGEELDLSSGSSSQWVSKSTLPKNQPLIWYKTKFDAPAGNDPVAIDFTGMGKGEAWVNGQSIGRFWPTYIASNGGCTDSCDYRGKYDSSKCLKNCGKPSQTMYHVPRSWLQPSGNTLVLFEEIGGNPAQISFATRQIGSLCSHVSETHPSPVDTWDADSGSGSKLGSLLSLECPFPGQVISSIKFASFGTPHGTCGSFSHGQCSSHRALAIVQKACVGSKSCRVGASINTFGDPCKGVTKSLAVEASCA